MRDLILIFLASYYVTWVIVHAKIASSYVERWQYHWEFRWITRATTDEEERARLAEVDGWNSRLAYLPTCAYCTGFWVSGAVTVTTTLFTHDPAWPLIWLASAAFVGLVDSQMHHEA